MKSYKASLADAVHDDQKSHYQLSIGVRLNDEAEHIIAQSDGPVHFLVAYLRHLLAIAVQNLAVSSSETTLGLEMRQR